MMRKLLEKNKTIWTKIEDLKNIKLNALLVYDDRFIKTEIRTYGSKFIIWYNIRIFYSHFFWFFTYIWKQILNSSIFRQLCL